MPTLTTLHSILKNEAASTSNYALDRRMELLSEPHLREMGMPRHTANAISGIVGRNPDITWEFCEVSKNPEIPDSGSEYQWDNSTRYYLRYENKAAGNDSYAIIIEYFRFDTPYDLRACAVKNGKVSEVKITDSRVREAMIAILLAAISEEDGSGNFSPFIAHANNFGKTYAKSFIDGKTNAASYLKGLFIALEENVDPAKIKTGEAPLAFEAEKESLNSRGNKMKLVMTGGETDGYINNDTGIIYVPADALVTLKAHSGITRLSRTTGAEEPITSPTFIEVMTTIIRFDDGSDGEKIEKLEPLMFALNPSREYSTDEKARLLEIPDWYIPVPEVVTFAKFISSSNQFERPFRNFLFRGPAGCGKTEGAKAMASMVGLPYGVVTGHAEMEFFDLTSMMVPRTETALSSEKELLEFLLFAVKDRAQSGDLFQLPSLSEIELFPEQVYETLTGVKNATVSAAECIAVLAARLMSFCKADAGMYIGETSKFKIVKSDLAYGMEYGWLVELQEMNTLLKPGTLVGLNNIMEYGTLRLPTGEVIKRHPDTVIVFTQNVGYAGTVEGNQSVYSRLELKCDLSAPGEDAMVKRIQSHVPQLEVAKIRTIVQTAQKIRIAHAQIIEGGSLGTREEIAWAKATCLIGDLREAARITIVPSCSEYEDDRASIWNSLKQSI